MVTRRQQHKGGSKHKVTPKQDKHSKLKVWSKLLFVLAGIGTVAMLACKDTHEVAILGVTAVATGLADSLFEMML